MILNLLPFALLNFYSFTLRNARVEIFEIRFGIFIKAVSYTAETQAENQT